MTNLQPLADPARELRRQFDEMTAPHRRALWQFCLKLTGNVWDAEDLAQETLLRAFGRLSLSWQPTGGGRPRTRHSREGARVLV